EILGLLAPYGVTPTGEGEGGVYIVPLTRLNSLVAVAFDRTLFDEIEHWLRLLDIPPEEGAGRQTFVYNVENAKAEDLAGVLNELFGGGGGAGGGGRRGGRGRGPRRGRGRRRTGSPGGAGRRRGRSRHYHPGQDGRAPGPGRSGPAAGPAAHLQGGGAHRRRPGHQLARRARHQARLPAHPRRAEEDRRRAAPGAARGDDRRDHAEQDAPVRGGVGARAGEAQPDARPGHQPQLGLPPGADRPAG